jgi:hypothetical protein
VIVENIELPPAPPVMAELDPPDPPEPTVKITAEGRFKELVFT